MNDAISYQQRILLACFGLAAVIAAVLFFKFEDNTYLYGLALGAAGGIIKLKMRINAVADMLNNPENGTSGVIRSTMTGHIIFGAIILCAFFMQNIFNIYATFGGFIIPNAVLILDKLLRPAQLQQTGPAGGDINEA